MFSSLQTLSYNAINIGCNSDEANIHKVRVTNTLAFVASIIACINIILFGMLSHSLITAIMNIGLLTICLSAVYLQHRRLYYIGRMVLLLSIISYIFIHANWVVGTHLGVQSTFFTLLPLPWLLLEDHRKRTKVVLSFLCCSCYFYIQYHQPVTPFIAFSHDYQSILQIGSELLAMLVLIVLAITFDNDRNKYENRLKKLATEDPLTGLANRTKLLNEGNRVLAYAKRHQEPLCVALLDIDHFKRVNDKYGHSHGDTSLKIIAKLLTSNLRESDLIARYGGEEFALILPRVNLLQATNILNKLREQIALTPICYSDVCINCSASFGVTQLNNPTQQLTELFDQADEALYIAKNQGRNCVATFQLSNPNQV
ncbi:GGDEF domain-containing protein [Pseudoalteromonas sp. SMS1]|uniref:GGDEF domain-containing protein n=1 Tax=Pseudoalteromonas sp. SMS1 TaxID=2908894 RepID=UPI001F3886A1|nr:GGDEF domain-containing protein [Pseudoalteromonas sp. SMS1]MCF2858365.1 GGDEF domain-containing protein [Pseudoalteromonas sp. SMS1]